MRTSALSKATLNPFTQPACLSVLVQAPVPVTEDTQRSQMTSTTSAPGSPKEAVEVRTENLFQRTEVLAGTCRHSSLLFRAAELRLLPVSVWNSSRLAPSSSRWVVLRECFSGKHLGLGSVGTISPIVSHLKHVPK